MSARLKAAQDRWSLTFDVLSAKLLVWVAAAGRDADLTPDAHSFFADRYRRLAVHHRRHGRSARADRLERLADQHLDASGLDGPPFAAAMAMPRPKQFLTTDAISRAHLHPPDDAA